MKKLIVVLLCVTVMFSLAVVAIASKIEGEFVGFVWDASTETDLAGYRIYRSDTAGSYVYGEESLNLVFDVACTGGNTTVACTTWQTDMTPLGTWFFVITAFDFAGNESAPSDELTETVVAYNPPPAPPTNWRFGVTP